jgi:hypothetical protein
MLQTLQLLLFLTAMPDNKPIAWARVQDMALFQDQKAIKSWFGVQEDHPVGPRSWQWPNASSEPIFTNLAPLALEVDLSRLWAWIADQPNSFSKTESIHRLGIDSATSFRLSASKIRKHLEGNGILQIPHQSDGFAAVWASPIPVVFPKDLPPGASYMAVSLNPSSGWQLLERVYAGVMPLEYAAFHLQLEQAQRDTHLVWLDALGGDPQRGEVLALPSKKVVITGGVKDGKTLWKILKTMLPTLQIIGATVTEQKPCKGCLARVRILYRGKHFFAAVFPTKIILANDLPLFTQTLHAKPTLGTKMLRTSLAFGQMALPKVGLVRFEVNSHAQGYQVQLKM